MKRLHHLFFISAFVATIFTFAIRIQPAHGACVIASGSTPLGSNKSFTNETIVGHTYTVIRTGIATFSFIAPISQPIKVSIPSGGTATIIDDSASCPLPITFFNPGDERINGEPGDRLVVYCNIGGSSPNIDVFVVDPDSTGKHLAQVPVSDLLKPNFSLDLGANGILTGAGGINSAGYIALTGGPYNATGAGDWMKTFSCQAS